MSCGEGHKLGLSPTWLWLWRRPVAIAPIGPLAWELPYAAGAALKRKKNKNKKHETFSHSVEYSLASKDKE